MSTNPRAGAKAPSAKAPTRRKPAAATPQEPTEPTPVERITPEAPSSAVSIYHPIESSLAQLRVTYKGRAYDLQTSAGLDEAKKDKQRLVRLRTTLEELRLDANRADRSSIEDRIKLRDAEAKRIEGEIRALETPIAEQIEAEVKRREDLRMAKVQAEQARLQGIQDRIATIRSATNRAHLLDVAGLEERIKTVVGIPIDESYAELQAQAAHAHAETLEHLRELLERAKQAAKQAAEAAKQADALAKARAELAAKQEAEAARLKAEAAEREQQAELERKQREAQAAAEKVRTARLQSIALFRTAVQGAKESGVLAHARRNLKLLQDNPPTEEGFGDLLETAEVVHESAVSKLQAMIDAAETAEREAAERAQAAAKAEAEARAQAEAAEARLRRVEAAAEAAVGWVSDVLATGVLAQLKSDDGRRLERRGRQILDSIGGAQDGQEAA